MAKRLLKLLLLQLLLLKLLPLPLLLKPLLLLKLLPLLLLKLLLPSNQVTQALTTKPTQVGFVVFRERDQASSRQPTPPVCVATPTHSPEQPITVLKACTANSGVLLCWLKWAATRCCNLPQSILASKAAAC